MSTDTGLLWYDDTKTRTLADKVAQAVAHYRAKYGNPPSVCFCHPSQHVKDAGMAAGVRVEKDRLVAPNHLWVCGE